MSTLIVRAARGSIDLGTNKLDEARGRSGVRKRIASGAGRRAHQFGAGPAPPKFIRAGDEEESYSDARPLAAGLDREGQKRKPPVARCVLCQG